MKPHIKSACTMLLAVVLCVTGLLFPVEAAEAITAGSTVQITADQAITYSSRTKTNVPKASYYPLPKGTRDSVVGKRISYKKDGKTYYYYNLRSGVRVAAEDIKAVSAPAPSNNRITGLDIRRSRQYTYVTIDTEQKVAYWVTNQAASANCISLAFRNTVSTPASKSFSSGIFSKAKWDGNELTLHFAKSNAFWGYKGYYNENGSLVLRFQNNPGKLDNARIVVDAGHGGKDNGALGCNANLHEKDINLLIAQELVEELEERGATVLLLESTGKDPQARKEMAEKLEADYFISIHCNSSTNKKATGTEVYYFHAFNKGLAASIAKNVSASLGTTNRGAKGSYYHVTLSSQMRSVLVETGFISNKTECSKLVQEEYQKKIASAIADSLERGY